MKVPRTFIPDKDLSKKIEELSTEPKSIDVEDLLKDNMRILYGDATPFQQIGIEDDIFRGIVEDTFAGKIEWKEDKDLGNYPPNISKRYRAEASVINYKGKEITLPVLFQIDNVGVPWGYLHLGNENGPCKNTVAEEIRMLSKKYFKIPLKKPKCA